MSWNHRCFRDKYGNLSFRETFYEEDGSVMSWSQDPITPIGYPEMDNGQSGGDTEALLYLKWTIAKYQGALCFPIIDEQQTLEMLRAKTKKTKPKTEKLKKSAE